MSSEANNHQSRRKPMTKKQREAIRRKKRQKRIILLVIEILVLIILAGVLFMVSKLSRGERRYFRRIPGDYEELYYHCLIWSGQPL